ncbi:acyltransferase [Aquabacterium sp.]|uniref:acyltransferase n=1 Tax=Aquabacterium sp. TaxID=1872578 RepID=UPI002CD64701|nr:acyltransferase [Aquabacterium sp.]HSW09188.1 acyltransferase [Aquabacterium sp.]
MLALLPAALRGGLTGLILGLNTVLVFSCMVPPALLKLVLPFAAVRRPCDRLLNGLASRWVAINNAWIASVAPRAGWDVQGTDGLHAKGWYLVSSNHQTWVDILVLQRIFHQRIPFLKFFLKRELLFVPVIGLAWWALDFPFMRRSHGRGGSDLKTTREACEKFKHIPTTVINFVEGTRFTQAKRVAERSPYQHLLKPKIGGMGMALATMGEQFEALLDVTIVYPQGTPSFWDLLCGRLDAVIVRVVTRELPAEVLGGDPVGNKAYRVRVGRWMQQQWVEKDRLIDELLAGRRPSTASSAQKTASSGEAAAPLPQGQRLVGEQGTDHQ